MLQLVFNKASADTSGRAAVLAGVVLTDAQPVFSTFPPLHTFTSYHPSHPW